MKKSVLLGLGIVICLVLILGGVKGCQIYKAMSNPFQPPPEAVSISKAEVIEWRDSTQAVGQFKAIMGADLRFDDSGRVAKVNIDSGSSVQKGAVLIELDTAMEEAELDGARALLKSSRSAYERSKTLFAKEAASVAKLESDEFAYHDAQAKVGAIEARIAKKRIVAPFDGVAGVRRVNIGEYVTSSTEVVPVYQLGSLYLDFSLPERQMSLISLKHTVEVKVDSFSDRVFTGVVTAIDPAVNSSNRNFMVRSLVENKDNLLRPGMFASVSILSPNSVKKLVVPSSGVVFAPYGDSIFVVVRDANSPALSVRQQFIKLGARRGDLVIVEDGLKEGDEVVNSAGFKLRPGLAVVIADSVRPDGNINPNPENR